MKEIMNNEAIKEWIQEAVKSVPKLQLPPWLNSIIEFIKAHPRGFALGLIVLALVAGALFRGFICWYYKTNKILKKLEEIEEKLQR